MVAMARRALDHLERGTTDQAAEVVPVPASEYADPDVWRHEVDVLFGRVPLAVALSIELPRSNDYKAMDVAGRPVLVVRGDDGVVRSYLNVCRHRGAKVCATGAGNTRRFTCPYHAWVYDDRGSLVGIYGAATFGDVDRAARGLVELPTEERCGIVWTVLDPAVALDLDDWLGDFAAQLDALELQDWHLHDQSSLDGPNWKVAYDGYLEGYHLQALHPHSVGNDTISNLMVVDTFGPHQRILFATSTLGELRDQPEEAWDLPAHCAPVYTIFPNVSIAGGWHHNGLVSTIYPTGSQWSSTTVQTIITRRPPETTLERAQLRHYTGLMRRTVRDEDYVIGADIDVGLRCGANRELLLGRNELTLQHFHAWVGRLTSDG